jgi:hypothetical protein
MKEPEKSTMERSLKYPVAPIDFTIKMISGSVLTLNIVFLIASLFISSWVFAAAVLLAVVTLYCFLHAPVAYEVSPEGLNILFRVGSKSFGRVLRANPVGKSDRSIRLWGNGGLFAGTGIFWNGTWGIFRAYVTTCKRESMVIVETATGKVVVSPDDRSEFITTCVYSHNHFQNVNR